MRREKVRSKRPSKPLLGANRPRLAGAAALAGDAPVMRKTLIDKRDLFCCFLSSAVIAAFCVSTVLGFVEDLDSTFKDTRVNDIWLVDFYAPWCGYCKKLEPIWHEVGAELRSSGSPVRVGKMDATAYSGMASEFGVRGYPTIKLLKADLAYNYKGPRTKDDIVEFANRVAGPAVRALPSTQMFEHMMKRHDVLFVYVGGDSPLKEKYNDAASELIVYTYFFSASEDAVPESISMPELPAVVVFKDGGYFTYDAFCSRCSPLIFPTAPTRLCVLAHHKAPGVLPRLYVCGGFSDVVVAGLYIADLGAWTAVLSGREKPQIKKRNLC
ncbi:Protein disulfide-isomerase TMX3 [Oryzias melastigma]|uniref:protein disulfide-isomerase n=1 Tax=Oryzias melastigma TaxID=30732 RepID=A0A834F453_ORYME|nr:Protein disulfide-isomerase TMX3 [Oryzias melastigma]